MKRETIRLGSRELSVKRGRHFISRARFLEGLNGFDGDIRAECLHRLGDRSRVMFSVAQAILGEAVASVQRQGAKTLKNLPPPRFRVTG